MCGREGGSGDRGCDVDVNEIIVMPSYDLRLASTQADDMYRMLALGKAVSIEQVWKALGPYTIQRHLELRHHFTILYVASGKVLDTSPEFIKCGGQSAHAWFVHGLLRINDDLFTLAKHALGTKVAPKAKAQAKSSRSRGQGRGCSLGHASCPCGSCMHIVCSLAKIIWRRKRGRSDVLQRILDAEADWLPVEAAPEVVDLTSQEAECDTLSGSPRRVPRVRKRKKQSHHKKANIVFA